METVHYAAGAELPDRPFLLEDANGAPLTLAAGWTATVTLSGNGITPIVKTTGILLADTSPNVTVQWTSADLGSLEVGNYLMVLQVRRNSDSKDRKVKVRLVIE